MAKIEYSALVNRIRGRISHSVLSNWKGKGIIKRHNSGVHQERSAKQQELRGMLSDLAGEFYGLSAIKKDLWRAYAGALPDAMTPLNAYLKTNLTIQKYYSGTSRQEAPPPSPSTPGFVQDMTVSQMTSGDFCFAWTSPATDDAAVIFDYWAMPGYDNTVSPQWTFGVTAGGSDLSVLLSTDYPTDTILKFRGRSVDSYGRTSPWSSIRTLPSP